MIFFVSGTHEASFKRAVKAIDELKGKGVITEDVILQTGYTDDYEPKYCKWEKFFPYDQTQELAKEAHILITHGGPSSFIMGLSNGKVPIVIPRRAEFGEHVNDHQVKFCHAVAERQGNILVVDDVNELENLIKNYDTITADMAKGMTFNNQRFCEGIENIANSLVKEK